MGEPMLGQIMAFAGNYTPRDWAVCAGELLTIMDYQALYAVMGTTWGGDGRTTMGVPDLRGRTSVGMGLGPGRTNRTIAQYGGFGRVTLAVDEMPKHNHQANVSVDGDVTATMNCYTGTSNIQSTPANNVMAQQGLSVPNESKVYSRAAPNAIMSSASISTQNDLDVGVAIGITGEGDSHENMPPWLCMNYIMALQGYFPQRTQLQ